MVEDSQTSDGETMAVEEEIWWPATICKHVKHDVKNGSVWELQYDELGAPRSDLTRWAFFCSADVLVDLDEREESKGERGSRCQWRKAGSSKQAPALLERSNKVKARYRGGTEWYAGVVGATNSDGSYLIRYDDGDEEEAVPRDFIKTVDVEPTIARDSETFWGLYIQMFISSQPFLSLSAIKQKIAAEEMALFREPIMTELENFKTEHGRGAVINGVHISKILRNVGYTFGGALSRRSEESDLAIAWKELVPGQQWRVEGHVNIGKKTLRRRDSSHSVSNSVEGKIVGWISQEDSEIAGSDDRYENEAGEAIAMYRNIFDGEDDGEDLDENEVKEAIKAWSEYGAAVQKIIEICGLRVESGKTRLQVFDRFTWDTSSDVRWLSGTIGDFLGTNSTLGFPCPVWVVKYDGRTIESKVGFVAPNSLCEFQMDDVMGVETSEELLMLSWRQMGEDFLPPCVAAEAAAAQESAQALLTPLQAALALIQNTTSLANMLKIVKNCVEKNEDKHRRLRLANPIIAHMLGAHGVKAAMLTMGWIEESNFLVLPAGIELSMSEVRDIDSANTKLQ